MKNVTLAMENWLEKLSTRSGTMEKALEKIAMEKIIIFITLQREEHYGQEGPQSTPPTPSKLVFVNLFRSDPQILFLQAKITPSNSENAPSSS